MNKNIIRLTNTYFIGLLALPTLLHINARPTVRASAETVITTRSSQSYIDSYYSSISPTATGNTLKSSLESLLKAERKRSFSYGSHQTAVFPYTDVDPARPHDGYIVSFYSGTPVKGYSGMNKEHTWPKSHGGNRIESDPHVIRPTLTSENSARGNMYYAQSPNPGWDPAEFDNPKYRGISARIIFYGATIGASSGLILEDVGRGQASGTGNKMGKLGDLLKWNFQYPVDQTEIIRNETLDLSLDYNRNPFIDDPSLACRIWGDTNTETRSLCAGQAEVDVESVSVTPTSGTVNLLGANKSLQLVGKVLPTNATNQTLTWQSSNPSVATVSNTGNVSALSVGETTITVRSAVDNTKFATATISVISEPIAVTGIALNKTTLVLQEGESSTLAATVSPQEASNKNVIWASSDPLVATVDNGVVSALKEGTATISATTEDGGHRQNATVTVTKAPVFEGEATKFTFTSKEWQATPFSFKNIAPAWGFDGTRGMQITKDGVTVGNSPYFTNISKVIIGTATSSNGVGTYSARLVDSINAQKGEGTQIGEEVYVNKAGSTIIEREFNLETPNGGGHVQIIAEAEESSIYIHHVTIVTELIPIFDPVGDAKEWAVSFLEETSEGCAQSSLALLQEAWSVVKVSYNNLSESAKGIISERAANPSGDDIEHAKARYNLLLNKYGLENFMVNAPQNTSRNNALSVDARYVIPLIIFSVIISGTLITTLVLKRKKQ